MSIHDSVVGAPEVRRWPAAFFRACVVRTPGKKQQHVASLPFLTLKGGCVAHGRSSSSPEVELCSFYEEYDRTGTDAVIAHGIYSLEDLKSEW